MLARHVRLAPVRPIVLHDGERRWRAAVEVGETVAAGGGGRLRALPALATLRAG